MNGLEPKKTIPALLAFNKVVAHWFTVLVSFFIARIGYESEDNRTL